MDVAGVIIGSIGLLLSLLLGSFELQRRLRFRKPRFHVERAEQPVEKEVQYEGRHYLSLSTGKVVLNVRGPGMPLMLREVETMYLRQDGAPLGGHGSLGVLAGAAGGTGVKELPFLFELPAEKWRRLHINLERMNIPIDTGRRPEQLGLEVYLRSPDETFVVEVPMELNDSGYSYNDERERIKHMHRTMWRERGPLKQRAFRRGRWLLRKLRIARQR